MTRNEAKKHFSYMYEDGFCKDDLMVGLDQIFNDHEEQLKAKDEEIERLRAEVEDLESQVNDYEQFSETIASARG